MSGLRSLNKPLVLAVEGAAIGIGCSMLLHADLVYASNTAWFQLPFVNLGLVPEFGLSYLLTRQIGPLKAKELLLTGKPFGAAEAALYGLVNQVCPPDQLQSLALEAAQSLAARPLQAVIATKKLIDQSQQLALDLAMDREFGVFQERLQSAEAKQAFHEFIHKR